MSKSTSHMLLWVGIGVAALYFLGRQSTANTGAAYQLPNGQWVTGAQGFPATGTGAMARYTPSGGTGRIY
jgi:hypothetical protein